MIAFYIEQPGIGMPRSAFLGPTPDEIYFGTGDQIAAELDTAQHPARQNAWRKTVLPGVSSVTSLIVV